MSSEARQLYVLTTDGYNREDGNVWYASFLEVTGDPDGMDAAVVDSINSIIGCSAKVDGDSVTVTFDGDVYKYDFDDLVTGLIERGYDPRVVNAKYIVEERG